MKLKTIRLATFTAAVLLASPALAVTAGDVLNRMSEGERKGYITGAVDMVMFRAATQEKNNKKSECILEWFYGANAAGPGQVIATFKKYPDSPAIPLIAALADKACGS